MSIKSTSPLKLCDDDDDDDDGGGCAWYKHIREIKQTFEYNKYYCRFC
jgi:hypothetical protein